jgi:hypothetical protein
MNTIGLDLSNISNDEPFNDQFSDVGFDSK